MILLDVIRRNGPIAKTDISRITKYNIVTVSNYVEHYIKRKLVVERGLDVSSGGRRPELVELNNEWGYLIGMDIGPQKLTCIVTTVAPKIIHKEVIDRPRGHMETVMSQAIQLVHQTVEASTMDKSKVKGIGVGISGVIDKHAGTVRDTDLDRGGTIGNFISAKSILEKEFHIPISIANDASLAALAEKKLSLRIDDENILYMYADVGSGMVANNDLFWGSSWSAGEIQLNLAGADQLNLPPWAMDSHFFKSRGLDMGLVADARILFEKKDTKCKLWEMIDNDADNITLEKIFEAVRKDDRPIVEIVDRAVTLLGLKVAYLTNFFNPEVVVLGGGLEKGEDFVLNGVRRVVKQLVMNEVSGNVKIILSRLAGDAVALGAVSLVTQELFTEV